MPKRNALYEVESTKGITDASGEHVEEWEVGDQFRLTEEARATHYREYVPGRVYPVASILLHREDPNDMSLLTPVSDKIGDPWVWIPIIDVERAV